MNTRVKKKKRKCLSPAVARDVSTNLCDLIISEDRNELMMSDLDAREDPGDRSGTEQRR